MSTLNPSLSIVSGPPSLVSQGITALHAGDKSRARALLHQATQHEPRNADAWLWLSGAVETDTERYDCLQQVLTIDPHHAAAQHGIKMLGTRLAPAVPAPPVASPAVPAFAALLAEAPLDQAVASVPGASLPALPAVDPENFSATTRGVLDAAVAAAPVAAPQYAVFLRDRFLLRQKVAFNEKYCVWDEHDQPILYVERPRYFLRNVLGFMGAAVFGILMMLLFIKAAGEAQTIGPAAFFGVMIVVAMAFTIVGPMLIYKKRNITFFRDAAKREPLLVILQDRKFQPINATYTIADLQGTLLGRLRKNYLYDIFRKRWYCYAPDGSLLCVAKEDSLLRSILRRAFSRIQWLNLIVAPLLRTNFVILRNEFQIGEFNRKFTLLDRYMLDMSADTTQSVDRRVALALGVMLDTGERR